MTEPDSATHDVEPFAPHLPDEAPPAATDAADEAADTLGDDRVDAAVRQLEGLEQLDVDDHAARYERAQEELRSALDDEATAPDRP